MTGRADQIAIPGLPDRPNLFLATQAPALAKTEKFWSEVVPPVYVTLMFSA